MLSPSPRALKLIVDYTPRGKLYTLSGVESDTKALCVPDRTRWADWTKRNNHGS